MVSRESLKRLRKLHQKKYREREGRFLAEGANLVQEALDSDFKTETIFVTHAFSESPNFEKIRLLAQKRQVAIEKLSSADFRLLSETNAPQGIVALIKKTEHNFFDQNVTHWQYIVALDGLQDPGNVGTIIRTADWYGCHAVILGQGSVELTQAKVLRATAGSVFHLPVFEGISLRQALSRLKNNGFALFAAESNGKKRHVEVQFPVPSVLVVGNERHGISAETKSVGLTDIWIPRRGRAESLNAAVATAVLLDRMVFSGNAS